MLNKFRIKVFGKPSVYGMRTGWMFTDSVINHKCPKCGCDPGYYCQTPKGRRTDPPHNERVMLMDSDNPIYELGTPERKSLIESLLQKSES